MGGDFPDSQYYPISSGNTSGSAMDFHDLQERLLRRLRDRISSGAVTERGLARLTGISQPHMHHVLKGKRALSPAMADKVLRELRMDLLDLLDHSEVLSWKGRQ